jgi:hypothetical protein
MPAALIALWISTIARKYTSVGFILAVLSGSLLKSEGTNLCTSTEKNYNISNSKERFEFKYEIC